MAAAACISTTMAQTQTPYLIDDAAFQRISPNGRYAVSEVYGTVIIFDTADGSVVEEFIADDFGTIYYSIGNGNCFNADGSILVGSTTQLGTASYFTGGEWIDLNVADEEMVNISNAITPDGSRICGSIGLSHMTFDDVIMQIPVYWDRNENGDGYGEYHILPYPTKDYFGESPQYVTALAIASDGKTIAGQMVFGNGAITIPVLYKQDEKGEWEYSLPTLDLINPLGLESVENPGDGPEGPYYEDYMTEEEREAYNQAIDDFYASSGGMSWPDFEDYMSEESLKAYTEAMDAYDEAYAAWREKYEAYADYIDGVLETSASFVFNNVMFSTDDKYIVSSLEMSDPNADPWSWMPSTIYRPASVNVETGKMETVDTELSLLASGVADDGVILAYNTQRAVPMLGYIIKDGNVQEIGEYIASVVPSYGEWINRNMTHEVAVDFDEDWNEIYEDLTFTGMPVATPDLSVITIWTNTPWDYSLSAVGVIFDMSVATSGVTVIGAENADLTVENGTLVIPAGFASVDIYNVNGACVKSVSGEGSVKLNLDNGVYVAKGTRADGSVSVIKLTK